MTPLSETAYAITGEKLIYELVAPKNPHLQIVPKGLRHEVENASISCP